jgi:integrase
MLRHGCGFGLADQGADTRLIQDYLGHRNIQHTFRHGEQSGQIPEALAITGGLPQLAAPFLWLNSPQAAPDY